MDDQKVGLNKNVIQKEFRHFIKMLQFGFLMLKSETDEQRVAIRVVMREQYRHATLFTWGLLLLAVLAFIIGVSSCWNLFSGILLLVGLFTACVITCVFVGVFYAHDPKMEKENAHEVISRMMEAHFEEEQDELVVTETNGSFSDKTTVGKANSSSPETVQALCFGAYYALAALVFWFATDVFNWIALLICLSIVATLVDSSAKRAVAWIEIVFGMTNRGVPKTRQKVMKDLIFAILIIPLLMAGYGFYLGYSEINEGDQGEGRFKIYPEKYICRASEMNYFFRAGYRWSYHLLLDKFEEPEIPRGKFTQKDIDNLRKRLDEAGADYDDVDTVLKVATAIMNGDLEKARKLALTIKDETQREYQLAVIKNQEELQDNIRQLQSNAW